MSDTFDRWEADAKEQNKWPCDSNPFNQRILALIELVRKKDEALRFYSKVQILKLPAVEPDNNGNLLPFGSLAREALALTENLNE